MKFSSDFVTAQSADGRELTFTRSEARALAYMARQPNRVLSRDQILDAVSEPGSGKSDRSIDFLINRLRRKLGDSSKEPRFIATRYGEGYIWVAERYRTPAEGDILVGPLLGLAGLKDDASSARRFADHLRNALMREVGPEKTVVLEAEYDPSQRARSSAPELTLTLSFFSEKGTLQCVVSAREGSTGRIIDIIRHRLKTDVAESTAIATRLAAGVLARIWRSRAAAEPVRAPLPVAMHDAAGMQPGTTLSWAENDKHLTTLMAANPDDAAVKLMYATHLHSKYVQLGWELFQKETDTCTEDEDTIERLVLEALPFAQSRSDYAVVAAKLLYFLDRGYRELAIDLAEEAHRGNFALGSSFAVVGQIRSFRGEHELAMTCLEQAASLSDRDSEFHVYVLVLICKAAMAAGDSTRLARAREELHAARPSGRGFFELLYSDADMPSVQAKAATMMISKRRGRATLKTVWYITARHYANRAHRENALRTPLTLLQNRFGRDVVPPEVARMVPKLLR